MGGICLFTNLSVLCTFILRFCTLYCSNEIRALRLICPLFSLRSRFDSRVREMEMHNVVLDLNFSIIYNLPTRSCSPSVW